MRKQLSKGGFRTVLSLLVMCVLVGVFLEYSETASSQKSNVPARPVTVDKQGASGAIPGPGFVSHKAEAFAVTPPVAQLQEPKVRISSKPSAEEKETKPNEFGILGEPEEKVENEIIKRAIPGLGADKGDGLFTDPLLKQNTRSGLKQNTGGKLAPTAMPTPNLTFDGITHTVGTVLPPDTNGDVGPNHYVQTTNSNNTGATSVAIFK